MEAKAVRTYPHPDGFAKTGRLCTEVTTPMISPNWSFIFHSRGGESLFDHFKTDQFSGNAFFLLTFEVGPVGEVLGELGDPAQTRFQREVVSSISFP